MNIFAITIEIVFQWKLQCIRDQSLTVHVSQVLRSTCKCRGNHHNGARGDDLRTRCWMGHGVLIIKGSTRKPGKPLGLKPHPLKTFPAQIQKISQLAAYHLLRLSTFVCFPLFPKRRLLIKSVIAHGVRSPGPGESPRAAPHPKMKPAQVHTAPHKHEGGRLLTHPLCLGEITGTVWTDPGR